ncbi:hypothetical protein HDU81_007867 [Chytriomyces hyalinus]|nr:hypothetical protein HDU81_007867 [Chytriomyces hyalinus]
MPGPIPTELGQFKKLQYLNLAMNQFSGGVPSEFAQLINLKELIITDNTFLTGTIPTELGTLQNLEKLQLSRNSLTGTVPDSLFSLSKLRDLELQNNLLSGPVPPLLRLNGKLDVSANCFDGQVPWNFKCPKGGVVSATTGVVSGTGGKAGGAGSSNSEATPPANNMAGIIGGVVGGLAVLIALVVAFVLFRKRKSNSTIQKDEAPRNAAVRYDSDLVKIKVNDHDHPASFTSLPQQEYDSKHVPSAYLNSNNGSSSSSQLPETISNDMTTSFSQPKNSNPEDAPQQQSPPPSTNHNEQIDFFAPAPGETPNYYAITESGLSSLTDPRRAVTSYRLLPEKNRAFASATESDLTSSRQTYAADEKVSYSGGAQLMAEPMGDDEGGELEPSFLDNLAPGGVGGCGGHGALDEKAMLRGTDAVPQKNSALFHGMVQQGGLNEATDARPLPEKESGLFQALHNPTSPEERNARNQQSGPELTATVVASWSIDQVAEWASKIERGGVGIKFAELVKQHQVTGQVLLQLTREDLRTDFGLNITDRLVVDDCIRQLKTAAGVGLVPQERDAEHGVLRKLHNGQPRLKESECLSLQEFKVEVLGVSLKFEFVAINARQSILEHGINGASLRKATVDDYRDELGRTKLGDRALFGEKVQALQEAAGLGGSGEERDAGVGSNGSVPPSYGY